MKVLCKKNYYSISSNFGKGAGKGWLIFKSAFGFYENIKSQF